jgi:4-amino-4-deoxy-L-arabinose transferase-like glycosyltransferase
VAILAFAFSAAALTATAVLAAATLRLRGSSFAIGAYLVGWAVVVGLGETLSLLDAVGRTGYVAGDAAVLVAAAAIWHVRGRPLPALPRPRLSALRAHLGLAALGAVVAAAVVYEAVLVVSTPPNNYDSLTYHLTRVVAWLQQGHVGYFDAATARANAFPPNAELGILYTVALLGRDTLAALPQLLAEVAVLVCVYGAGRRLGFGRPSATFAALLTATLSEFALESVTTQNDLVVAAFVIAAVYFVLGRERGELPLAALAVALAVGTKVTAFFALPLLVVAAALLLPRRRAVELAVWSAIAFFGFGAFSYVENTIHTGHPLGVVPEADPYRPEVTVGGTASTAARVYWRFVDFTGLQPPEGLLQGLTNTGSGIFAAAHIPANPPRATATRFSFRPSVEASEDTSYFGVLGFLLVVPVSAAFVLAWLFRRTSRARGLLAAALPLFVLVLSLAQTYDQWLGRFMLIPVALVMPLAAWLYERRLRLLTTVAALAGVATLAGTHTHNVAKPVGVVGPGSVWAMSRAQVQGLTAGSLELALPFFDATVPANATVGVVLGSNDPAYLLYGPTLRRRLVELPSRTAFRDAAERHLRWLVVSADAGPVAPRAGWRSHPMRGGWQVFWSDGGAA